MDRNEDRLTRLPPMAEFEHPSEDSEEEEDEYALMYEWAELLIAPPPFLEG